MYRIPTLQQQGLVGQVEHSGNEGFDIQAMCGFEWMEEPEPFQKPVVRILNLAEHALEEDDNLRRLEDIYKDIKQDLLKAQKEHGKGGKRQTVLKEDYEDLFDSEKGMTSGDDSEEIKCEELKIQECFLSYFDQLDNKPKRRPVELKPQIKVVQKKQPEIMKNQIVCESNSQKNSGIGVSIITKRSRMPNQLNQLTS